MSIISMMIPLKKEKINHSLSHYLRLRDRSLTMGSVCVWGGGGGTTKWENLWSKTFRPHCDRVNEVLSGVNQSGMNLTTHPLGTVE